MCHVHFILYYNMFYSFYLHLKKKNGKLKRSLIIIIFNCRIILYKLMESTITLYKDLSKMLYI